MRLRKRFLLVLVIILAITVTPWVSAFAAVGHTHDTNYIYYTQLPLGAAFDIIKPANWAPGQAINIRYTPAAIVPWAISTNMKYGYTLYDVKTYMYTNQTTSAQYLARVNGSFNLSYQGSYYITPHGKKSYWVGYDGGAEGNDEALPVTYLTPEAPGGPSNTIFSFFFKNVYEYTQYFQDKLNTEGKIRVQPFLVVLWSSPTPLDFAQMEFQDGVDVKLVGIADSLNRLESILNLANNLQQQTNTHLLGVIDAINKLSVSGGGTQGIIDKLETVGNAILTTGNQIVAQQIAAADKIIAAGNANTAALDATIKLVEMAVDNTTAELKRQADENIRAANEKPNEIAGLVSDMESEFKTRWSAFSFPIEFGNRIFDLFKGTSSASFARMYGDVIRYSYNKDTGKLEPVRAPNARLAAQERAVTGTRVTFPSFDLPMPGGNEYRLWESFTFDMAELVDWLEPLFDALYVASGILMIYWCVDDILDMFSEIIAGD